MTAAAAKAVESVLIGIEDWMLDDLLALIKASRDASGSMSLLSYSESRVARTLQAAIDGTGIFSKVSVNMKTKEIEGVLVAMPSMVYYSEDPVVNTVIFHVAKEHQGSEIEASLVGAYEAWAQKIGAKVAFISCWSHAERGKVFPAPGWIESAPHLMKTFTAKAED